jgi:arginase family enzyme
VASAEDLTSRGVVPALRPALDRFEAQVGRLYVHIDLDVLDRAEAAANERSSTGGLSTLRRARRGIRAPFREADEGPLRTTVEAVANGDEERVERR